MQFSRNPSRRFIDSPILFEADKGTEPGGQSNPQPDPTKPEPSKPSVQEQIQSTLNDLLRRHDNSPNEALVTLIKQNHAQSVAIADLQAAQPTDADRADLQAYRDLKQKHGDIEKALNDAQAATEKVTAYEQDQRIGQAAGVLKLNNNALFRSLLKGVEISVEGDGEDAKVSVKDGDKLVSFEDYAKGRPELQDALPALQAQVGGQRNGANWLPQGSSGETRPGNVYDGIREQVKAKEKAQSNQTGTAAIAQRLGRSPA